MNGRRSRALVLLLLAGWLWPPTRSAEADGKGLEANGHEWVEIERSEDPETGFVLLRAEDAPRALYRLVTSIEEPPEVAAEAALRLVTREEYAPPDQKRTTLRRTGEEVLLHIQMDLPVVADRDVVAEVRVDRDPARGAVIVRWDGVEGEGPGPAEGVVRVESLRGFFAFSPTGGRTRVTYEAEADLGGQIPSWLATYFFPEQVKRQVTRLRRAIADLGSEPGRAAHRSAGD